jgi:hypothetical protein
VISALKSPSSWNPIAKNSVRKLYKTSASNTMEALMPACPVSARAVESSRLK